MLKRSKVSLEKKSWSDVGLRWWWMCWIHRRRKDEIVLFEKPRRGIISIIIIDTRWFVTVFSVLF